MCVVEIVDGFGEKGVVFFGDVKVILSDVVFEIEFEFILWKVVEEVIDDKKVIKKILMVGEGYEKFNDGLIVKGIFFNFVVKSNFYK